MARITLIICMLLLTSSVYSEDKIKLKITTIKGNKDLPRILYIVPWKDIKKNKKPEQKLVLHSLFGDLFDPILPKE